MATGTSKTSKTKTRRRKRSTAFELLAAALRAWWAEESADWDDEVDSSSSGDTDLWDDIPEVDSKAVARSTHLFEQHLGVPLEPKLIRPGGYDTIEEMIEDLVPKMLDASKKSKATRGHRNG